MLNNPIDLMRLRVDQNGSLVAPQSLSDAFERHARAEMDDAELRAIEDEAIVDVVRKQEAIGWPRSSLARCQWLSMRASGFQELQRFSRLGAS